MRITLDPGHGGRDPGAVGKVPDHGTVRPLLMYPLIREVRDREGDEILTLHEADVTLAVAEHLERALESKGHEVQMTRRMDRSLELESRARFANRHEADLFISIHCNASLSGEAEGMEVFRYPGSVAGHQLASSALKAMLAEFPGHKNRGVKSVGFKVLRLTKMPAILVELEFINHPRQLEFLANPENQRRLAEAIARGVG